MPESQSKPMTIFLHLAIALILLQTHLPICNGISDLSLNLTETDAMLKRVCGRKAGECIEAGEEGLEMDSESNRRVLMMQKKYISYDTLKKDVVPCERPGASYYNCHSGGVANPYTRGCEVISGCRSSREIKS